MSQKTGDSFAMHSISYSNETGRDIVLCLSAAHTNTRPKLERAFVCARVCADLHERPITHAAGPQARLVSAPQKPNSDSLLTMIRSPPQRCIRGMVSAESFVVDPVPKEEKRVEIDDRKSAGAIRERRKGKGRRGGTEERPSEAG